LSQEVNAALVRRLGQRYAEQRLKIEEDHEAQIFGQGLNFFHFENWYSSPWLIRNTLRLVGLYRRGLDNAARVELRHNQITLARLPKPFDGLKILHISDMHVDMNAGAMRSLTELVEPLEYDLCVLTGDYRGKTWGPFRATLDGLARVRPSLRDPVYGVLGNHDTVRMVPGLEELGIRMLVNECETIPRGNDCIHLAGIDDAHFFRVDNIEKALEKIPASEFSILLSHTPEIYRQAASAGIDLLLSGHTHGGQICLPGSIPITLDSVLPRYMGSGPWAYRDMLGYTSAGAGSCIVPVRFNCPPSITLHRLQRAQ
jgi:predicted MPP superfamily phosphohydrolase